MLTLTANQRQAAYLKAKQEDGVLSPIMAFSSWLPLLLQRLQMEGLLKGQRLSLLEAKWMWQQHMQDLKVSFSKNPQVLAQSYTAYEHCWHWNLNLRDPRFDLNPITKEFKDAVQSYLNHLNQKKLLDSNLQYQALYQQLNPELLKDYSSIELYGFMELQPWQHQLFERLKAFGIEVNTSPQKYHTPEIHIDECEQFSEELTQSFLQANAWLSEDPNCNIGIVVKNIATHRELIERQASQVLGIEDYFLWTSLDDKNFSLTSGLTLDQYSIIVDLFNFFHWVIAPPDQKNNFLEKIQNSRYFHLNDKLGQYNEISPKTKKTPSAWITFFTHLTTQAGWPGVQPVKSIDYQIILRLIKEWKVFHSWDALTGSIDAHGFLKLLHFQMQHIIFQGKSDHAKIHILGMLEASDIEFDYLWVTQMSEEDWPEASHPTPYIPIAMQHEFQLPHASFQREYEIAQKIQQSLIHHCKNRIVFSFTGKKEGIEIGVSPLLLQHQNRSIKQSYTFQQKFPFLKDTPLESREEDRLSSLTSPFVKHGHQVIQDQYECPMRAALMHRFHLKAEALNALPLEKKELGFILHEVLKQLWSRYHSHEVLLKQSQAQLASDIDDVMNEVISRCFSEPSEITQNAIEIQKQLFRMILITWFEYEKKRRPFRIESVEAKATIQVGPIQLEVRSDRIDKINEDYFIIDYKYKNKEKIQNINPESELKELQLMLYATHLPLAMMGYAYACLSHLEGEMGFKGIVADVEFAKEVRLISNESWEQMKHEWKNRFTQLAEEFYQGYAEVKPLHSSVCQYCDFMSVCRIKEIEHAH